MKKIVILASVLFLSLAVISAASAADIRLGTLMAQTGPLKEYGPPIKDGAVLAGKQMAAAGFEIEWFHEDSETNPAPAANAAKKLVNVNNVVGIVGALSSGVTLAVAESVTLPNNVILISPASTNPLMTVLPADEGKDFLFRTCPSDALQGVVAGKLAASYNKTVSILYVNNAYGQGLAEVFTESFAKYGGKVLAAVPHDEKAAESYTAELKKALAGNPDRLLVYSYPEHAKVYVKEALEFYKFGRFLFCDGTKSTDIMDAVGAKALEGQKGTAPGTVGGTAFDKFNEYYKAEYGQLPPKPFITNAYDGAAILGLAAYAAKVKGLELTAANIRDHMRLVANPPGEVVIPGEFEKAFALLKAGKAINYEGAAGSVDFDEHGDVVTPIEIWAYKGGQLVTLTTETP
jgi:ABC-type branched-subunit amino acid transport system substrate-binding protein